MRAGRIVLGFVVGAILVYAFVVGAAWLGQRKLIYPAPAGAQPIPDGYTRILLQTSDGLTLEAAWRDGLSDRPVIVFFHGNGDRLSGAAQAVAPLARAGYAVLLPEYRGYSGNPGSPDEDGLYRDGDAAIDWLRGRGIAAERIVPVGNSLGSGVAARMAVKHGLDRLVLVSPFTSLPDAAGNRMRFLPVRQLMKDRYDNRAMLRGYGGRALILHGARDTLIPMDHARELAGLSGRFALEAFDNAGHELVYLPESGRAIRRWLEGEGALPSERR